MMGEAIEERAGQALGAEDRGPLVEGQVRGDDGGAAFVALAEGFKQQFSAGRRQRHIAKLIDDEQFVQSAQAVPPHRHPLRQDRQIFPGIPPSGRRKAMAASLCQQALGRPDTAQEGFGPSLQHLSLARQFAGC